MNKILLAKKNQETITDIAEEPNKEAIIKTINLDAESKTHDSNKIEKQSTNEKVEALDIMEPKTRRQKAKYQSNNNLKQKTVEKKISLDDISKSRTNKRKLTKKKEKHEHIVQDFDLISDDVEQKDEIDIISQSSHKYECLKQDDELKKPENLETNDVLENIKDNSKNDNKAMAKPPINIEPKENKDISLISKAKSDIIAPAVKRNSNNISKLNVDKPYIVCEEIQSSIIENRPYNTSMQQKNINGNLNDNIKLQISSKVVGLVNKNKKTQNESQNTKNKEPEKLETEIINPMTSYINKNAFEIEKISPAKKKPKDANYSKPVKSKSNTDSVCLKKKSIVSQSEKQSISKDMKSENNLINGKNSLRLYIDAFVLLFKISESEVLNLMNKYDNDDKRVRDFLIAKQLNKLLIIE